MPPAVHAARGRFLSEFDEVSNFRLEKLGGLLAFDDLTDAALMQANLGRDLAM